MKITDIVPVTDLRQNAAAVLKKLQGSDGLVVMTHRGRTVAVLQSIDACEKSEHERDFLHLLAIGAYTTGQSDCRSPVPSMTLRAAS